MTVKPGPWTARAGELFPEGTTLHFVARAETSGPGQELTGQILIEAPDGRFRRVTGEEIALIEELWPGSVRHWRIHDSY